MKSFEKKNNSKVLSPTKQSSLGYTSSQMADASDTSQMANASDTSKTSFAEKDGNESTESTTQISLRKMKNRWQMPVTDL
jgi:hypothetical protein